MDLLVVPFLGHSPYGGIDVLAYSWFRIYKWREKMENEKDMDKDKILDIARQKLKIGNLSDDASDSGTQQDYTEKIKAENERLKKELEETRQKAKPTFSELLTGADPEKIMWHAVIKAQVVPIPEDKLQEFTDNMKAYGVEVVSVEANRKAYKVNNENTKK